MKAFAKFKRPNGQSVILYGGRTHAARGSTFERLEILSGDMTIEDLDSVAPCCTGMVEGRSRVMFPIIGRALLAREAGSLLVQGVDELRTFVDGYEADAGDKASAEYIARARALADRMATLAVRLLELPRKVAASVVAPPLAPVAGEILERTIDAAEALAMLLPPGLGKCRVCGCTDDDCRQCIEKLGLACSWANADHTLCTACVS